MYFPVDPLLWCCCQNGDAYSLVAKMDWELQTCNVDILCTISLRRAELLIICTLVNAVANCYSY
jgi:hypothetical protein